MHEDERRNLGFRRKMLVDDFAANSDEMYSEYLALIDRNQNAGGDEARERRLERDLARRELEKQDLFRELGKARSALDAYRKETRRLKDDLRRVRNSSSMRIGKAVTRPIAFFRRDSETKRTDRKAASLAQHGNEISSVGPEIDATRDTESSSRTIASNNGPETEVSSNSAHPPVSLWELTTEDLESLLESESRVDTFSALLNRLWFQRGDIRRCERLLEQYRDLTEDLPEEGRVLVARIRGVARLRQARQFIPPRSHGAAYRVEADRVMYCVHSTPFFDSNGYSTRTRGLADGLHSNGIDVVVVSRIGYPWDLHPSKAPKIEERDVGELGGVEYVHIPGANINRDPLDQYVLKAADAYVREAKIRRPQRIQAASNFRQALPALIAARRLGIPFIYEVRGLWEITEASSKDGWEDSERFALQVELESLVATEADHVLAITAQVRDELIKRGVPATRISIAANAVDTTEFVPLPKDLDYARNVGISLDRPVLGFAGSIVAYEGLDVLLRAVRKLRDRSIPVQVVIAGSGSAEAQLRALNAELQLEDDVTFLGRLPAEDIPRLLSVMDIMPCPRVSTRVTELVSPLKPLESLASGKTVVLSDVRPQVDLAPPGSGRALLVPADNVEALADTLAEVLDDSDLARAVARAGRLWAVRERTWNVVSAEVKASYRDADRRWQEALTEVPTLALEQIRLGIIADEFTTETLSHRVELVPISRKDPLAALEQGLDAILVESAWEGNGGEWFHGVGYYDSEQFASLDLLLRAAAEAGIPRLFWNKEDPVHYRRFIPTAVHFDHIFSTDASLLGDYLAAGMSNVRTVSALPFYAEPVLHNPIQRPAELGSSTAMYAGTYYGQRYATRSKELAGMLRAALPFGLTIYDRQHGKTDTPYRFPSEFDKQIQGALPYREVLRAYRRHSACLNVNSVTESPSMFSRRVVEAAASGGVVLSGAGRGVVETFGGAIPASGDPHFQRALLRAWAADPTARIEEAWFQLRSIARSHTTETALAILLRTAGIAVDGPRDPRYIARLTVDPISMLDAVLAQSVPPAAVAVPDESVAFVRELTHLPVISTNDSFAGIRELGVEAVIDFTGFPSRTFAEDLVIAHRFRGDTEITAREFTPEDDPRLLAARVTDLPIGEHYDVVGRFALLDHEGRAAASDDSLTLVLPPVLRTADRVDTDSAFAQSRSEGGDSLPEVGKSAEGPLTILVAGHDLKFIESYIATLDTQGHTVLIDKWNGHSGHDEEKSKALLAQADVIWCEWGLGNAVWYSRHVESTQRLVVRVHLQEIDLPYLRSVRVDAVNTFVFVGEQIRRAAVEGHGVPADRAIVVPNAVPIASLDQPKVDNYAHTLGLVGIVPQRKRLDLAIDLIAQLSQRDPSYRLRIKGKRPEEYPWMEKRPEEMCYYREQYDRIERLNAERGEEIIGFDAHGSDMAEWYRRIGVVISVSDFESFHLTLADGAASGADAVSLAWDGADLIYPESILFADIPSMVDGLLDGEESQRRKSDLVPVIESFDERIIHDHFTSLLYAGGSEPTGSPGGRVPS